MHIGCEHRDTQAPPTSAAMVQDQPVFEIPLSSFHTYKILKTTPGVQKKATCTISDQHLRLRGIKTLYSPCGELEESELRGDQLKYLTQSILPPQPKDRALAILKYNPPLQCTHLGRVPSSPQLDHYSGSR